MNSWSKLLVFTAFSSFFTTQAQALCSFRQMNTESGISVLAEPACTTEVLSNLCRTDANIGKLIKLNNGRQFELTRESCVQNEERNLAVLHDKNAIEPNNLTQNTSLNTQVTSVKESSNVSHLSTQDLYFIQFWAGSHMPKAGQFDCIGEALHVVKVGGKFFLLSSGDNMTNIKSKLNVLKETCEEARGAWIRSGSQDLWNMSMHKLNVK